MDEVEKRQWAKIRDWLQNVVNSSCYCGADAFNLESHAEWCEYKKIASDWRVVGNDLRGAMGLKKR